MSSTSPIAILQAVLLSGILITLFLLFKGDIKIFLGPLRNSGDYDSSIDLYSITFTFTPSAPENLVLRDLDFAVYDSFNNPIEVTKSDLTSKCHQETSVPNESCGSSSSSNSNSNDSNISVENALVFSIPSSSSSISISWNGQIETILSPTPVKLQATLNSFILASSLSSTTTATTSSPDGGRFEAITTVAVTRSTIKVETTSTVVDDNTDITGDSGISNDKEDRLPPSIFKRNNYHWSKYKIEMEKTLIIVDSIITKCGSHLILLGNLNKTMNDRIDRVAIVKDTSKDDDRKLKLLIPLVEDIRSKMNVAVIMQSSSSVSSEPNEELKDIVKKDFNAAFKKVDDAISAYIKYLDSIRVEDLLVDSSDGSSSSSSRSSSSRSGSDDDFFRDDTCDTDRRIIEPESDAMINVYSKQVEKVRLTLKFLKASNYDVIYSNTKTNAKAKAAFFPVRTDCSFDYTCFAKQMEHKMDSKNQVEVVLKDPSSGLICFIGSYKYAGNNTSAMTSTTTTTIPTAAISTENLLVKTGLGVEFAYNGVLNVNRALYYQGIDSIPLENHDTSSTTLRYFSSYMIWPDQNIRIFNGTYDNGIESSGVVTRVLRFGSEFDFTEYVWIIAVNYSIDQYLFGYSLPHTLLFALLLLSIITERVISYNRDKDSDVIEHFGYKFSRDKKQVTLYYLQFDPSQQAFVNAGIRYIGGYFESRPDYKNKDKVAIKMHGRGKCFYREGSIYEGDFVQDMKHGLGTLTRPVEDTTKVGNGNQATTTYKGRFIYDEMENEPRVCDGARTRGVSNFFCLPASSSSGDCSSVRSEDDDSTSAANGIWSNWLYELKAKLQVNASTTEKGRNKKL